MKPIIAAALLLAALPTIPFAASPAGAGGPTCRGLEATHVGSPNENLTTTPGPDVVVSNGAFVVRTLNGDDVICVTGAGRPFVAPGGGDDVVDAREYDGDQLETSLGLRQAAGSSGDDTYLGGDQIETVFVSSGVAGDHKLIRLDGGDDDLRVDSGYPGTLDANLGKGADRYWTERSRPGSEVDGEEGRDHLQTKCLGCRRFSIRLGTGAIEVDQHASGRATDFEDAYVFDTRSSPLLRKAVVHGTHGPNRIEVTACLGVLDGRAGNDALVAHTANDAGCGGSRGRLYGGAGDDALTGTDRRDELRGGPGTDHADGRGDSDLCRAETVVRCER